MSRQSRAQSFCSRLHHFCLIPPIPHCSQRPRPSAEARLNHVSDPPAHRPRYPRDRSRQSVDRPGTTDAQFMFLKEFAQTERGVRFNPPHLGFIQSERKQQTGRDLSNEQGSGLSLMVREMALTGNCVPKRELLIIGSLERMRVAPLHWRPNPAQPDHRFQSLILDCSVYTVLTDLFF
jgi:hypothetical protein